MTVRHRQDHAVPGDALWPRLPPVVGRCRSLSSFHLPRKEKAPMTMPLPPTRPRTGRSRPRCSRSGAPTPTGGRSTTPSRRSGPGTCGWCGGSASPRSTPPTRGSGSATSKPGRLEEFRGVLGDVGLTVPAISTSRRSVMDPLHGKENLAYSHRLLDAAAELGVPMVSFGFFQDVHPGPAAGSVVLAGRGMARRRVGGGPQPRGSLIRELAEHAAGNGSRSPWRCTRTPTSAPATAR